MAQYEAVHITPLAHSMLGCCFVIVGTLGNTLAPIYQSAVEHTAVLMNFVPFHVFFSTELRSLGADASRA